MVCCAVDEIEFLISITLLYQGYHRVPRAIYRSGIIDFTKVLCRTELDGSTDFRHTKKMVMHNRTMKQKEVTKQKRLGFGAGLLMSVLGRKPKAYSDAQLHKNDFHPNTQKMGLRFSERLRKVWRPRWLRVK